MAAATVVSSKISPQLAMPLSRQLAPKPSDEAAPEAGWTVDGRRKVPPGALENLVTCPHYTLDGRDSVRSATLDSVPRAAGSSLVWSHAAMATPASAAGIAASARSRATNGMSHLSTAASPGESSRPARRRWFGPHFAADRFGTPVRTRRARVPGGCASGRVPVSREAPSDLGAGPHSKRRSRRPRRRDAIHDVVDLTGLVEQVADRWVRSSMRDPHAGPRVVKHRRPPSLRPRSGIRAWTASPPRPACRPACDLRTAPPGPPRLAASDHAGSRRRRS
jgi:hypothetical protein